MFSVLFWNLHGRKIENRERRARNLLENIVRLSVGRSLDMLVFAECGIGRVEVLSRLNAAGIGVYHSPETKSRKLSFFTRLEESAVVEAFGDPVGNRLSVLKVDLGNFPPILLAGLHFHDRMSLPSNDGRTLAASEMARTIESVEEEEGHQRTVLVGDLNMNPFDGGVVGAGALHAVMTRSLADSVPKLASRKNRRCFYNPMWAHFGDGVNRPAGTYYFSNVTDPANHFWNVYDQALLRPDLMRSLAHLEIVESDGTEPLVTKNGRPRRGTHSDHLPLFFQLDLQS